MSRKVFVLLFAAASAVMGCHAHARVGSVHAGGGVGYNDHQKSAERVALNR